MSMSTHIVAYIPDTDPEYIKHKKIFELCIESDVSLPVETEAYFPNDIDDPEEKLEINLVEGEHYKNWRDESREGFEIELSKLPKSVTKIRFFNAY